MGAPSCCRREARWPKGQEAQTTLKRGPILLVADHQTAGGYSVVAEVARVDLPLGAQLGLGDGVRFWETALAEAQDAGRRSELVLEELGGLGTG